MKSELEIKIEIKQIKQLALEIILADEEENFMYLGRHENEISELANKIINKCDEVLNAR